MSTPIRHGRPANGRLEAAPDTNTWQRGSPPRRGQRLPATWPLSVLFVAFPVWWLLGIGAFTWIVVPIPMLAMLIWRRQGRAPVAIILWFAFTSWVLLSGLQLESGTKIITFSYRLALYAAAGVLFVYTYNLPRSSTLDTKILRILTAFWMIVVAGGYAGILVGAHTFVPPVEKVLPGSLSGQPFVQELVRPVFAEVQGFLGFPIPRPAAPFTYSNYWGGNMAVLTPVAIAGALAAGRGARRKIIIVVLFASVVPMVFSLNRGMFLSLGLGLLYVSLRLALRGRLAALGSIFGIIAVVVLVVVATPLGHLVTGTFSSTHGHSNSTRLSASTLAITGARQAPIFGQGEPQQVAGQSRLPPIGTQGQLWTVLYSNGIPATVFFVGFFLVVLWQTRRARGMTGLWLHTVPLIALPQTVVYGWLPVELQLLMVLAALAYRYCRRPALPPVPSARRRAVGGGGSPPASDLPARALQAQPP